MSGYGSLLGMATSGVWEFFLDHSFEWLKRALCPEPVKSKVTSILFSQKKIQHFLVTQEQNYKGASSHQVLLDHSPDHQIFLERRGID